MTNLSKSNPGHLIILENNGECQKSFWSLYSKSISNQNDKSKLWFKSTSTVTRYCYVYTRRPWEHRAGAINNKSGDYSCNAGLIWVTDIYKDLCSYASFPLPFPLPLATTRFPLPRAWMRARAALWDLINTWLAFLCGRRSEPLSTSLFLFLYNSPPKIDLCRFLQWSSIHYDRETGYSHGLITINQWNKWKG